VDVAPGHYRWLQPRSTGQGLELRHVAAELGVRFLEIDLFQDI